jgi:hypothetical protein
MIRSRVLGTCLDGIVAGVENLVSGVEGVEDVEDVEAVEAVEAVEEHSSATLRHDILA